VTDTYRILFMGTPDFAVPTLRLLHRSHHQVVQVVTQPDRPRGRGRKLLAPPVKPVAVELGYEVVQPLTAISKGFQQQLAALDPDVLVVVAYGQVLPSNLLEIPRVATVNIHGSILPKYRGPAPIQRAIMNGEVQTGVTTMFIDEGVDTGDILLTQTVPIEKDDTSQTLHDRLAEVGAKLLLKTLQGFLDETIRPIPQDHTRATYAPRLEKADGHIDWKLTAEQIGNMIRGVTPWPGAFTFQQDQRLKILRALPLDKPASDSPGMVVDSFPGELLVATGDGLLSILEIQGASGKRLSIEAFLRGRCIKPGTRFT